MTKLLSIFSRAAHPNINALSGAASDPPIAPSAIASHLSGCDDCTRRVAELRAVRIALQALPAEEAPRSFRLRRADIQAAQPERAAPPGARALRLMPAMSALAVVLFAALVGADVLSNRGGGSSDLRAATTQGLASRSAQVNAQVPAPALPEKSIGSDSAGGAAPTPAEPSAPAVPAVLSTMEDVATPGIEAAAGRAADNAPVPTPEAGTNSSPPSSDRQGIAPTAAARTSQPQGEAGSSLTPAGPTGRDSGRTTLRIAEAIVAAFAIGCGAIAVSRRATSKGV